MYRHLEQLEQRLSAIEDELLARLRAAAIEEAVLDARRFVDPRLNPYRGKITTDYLRMIEKSFLDRRLLEAAGLTSLSLFYL